MDERELQYMINELQRGQAVILDALLQLAPGGTFNIQRVDLPRHLHKVARKHRGT